MSMNELTKYVIEFKQRSPGPLEASTTGCSEHDRAGRTPPFFATSTTTTAMHHPCVIALTSPTSLEGENPSPQTTTESTEAWQRPLGNGGMCEADFPERAVIYTHAAI